MTEEEVFIRRKAVADWIARQGKRSSDQLTMEEYEALKSLLAPHKGFGVFLSLVMFDRSQDLEELSNTKLGTPEGIARASELQGQVRAVDRLYELVVSIAEPIEEA